MFTIKIPSKATPRIISSSFILSPDFIGVIAALLISFEKQPFRQAERFIIEDNPLLTLNNGKQISTKLVDISLNGCALELENPLEDADSFVGSPVTVSIDENKLKLQGKFHLSRSWGKKIIILFDELNKAQHTYLINFIFDHQETGYGSFDAKQESFLKTMYQMISKSIGKLKKKH